MHSTSENERGAVEDRLLHVQVSEGVSGSKDGTGIGHLVDVETVDGWLRDYLGGLTEGAEEPALPVAFRFGVRAEGRYAGQSFIEAEPEVRSEWSSERIRAPWESIRDAVWAGFDRARDRRV